MKEDYKFSVPESENLEKKLSSESIQKMKEGEIVFLTKGQVPPVYAEKLDMRSNIIKWGIQNSFPNECLNILQSCPEHSAIAKKVALSVYGKGFYLEETQTQNFMNFIANDYGDEDLQSVVEKITWDYLVTGCFAIEVVWGKGGKMISFFKHIPIQMVRKNYDKDGEPDSYKICQNWLNISKYEQKKIVSFDPSIASEYPNQIYFYKTYVPGCDKYSVPLWFPGTSWILLSNHIGNFHLYNILNGHNPSVLYVFKKAPHPDVQRKIVEAIDERYKGAEKTGNPVFYFAENPDYAPEITILNPNQNDKQFDSLIEVATQKIMNCWGVTDRSIIGEITSEGFSQSSDRTLTGEYRFQENVIDPIQSVIESNLTHLGSFCGIADEERIILNKKMDEEKYAMLKNLFSPAQAKEIQKEEEEQDDKNAII